MLLWLKSSVWNATRRGKPGPNAAKASPAHPYIATSTAHRSTHSRSSDGGPRRSAAAEYKFLILRAFARGIHGAAKAVMG